MDLKVFGERNSGNNYLMHLLLENFDKQHFRYGWIRNHGWTHGFPNPKGDDIAFLIIVKNPFSWLLSMHKKPHTKDGHAYQQMPFSKFIRSSFEGYETPIHLWNAKYKAYLKTLHEHEHFLIRYEDLLRDYDFVLREVRSEFALTMKRSKMVNIMNETKPNGTLKKEKFDRKSYYLNQEWKKKLSLRDIRWINFRLDNELLKEMCYEKL